MNNIESGKDLLSIAKRILERDLEEAWKDNDDNLVVRRAQEVVELTLKGALKFLGVEYPKVHDVGKIFEQTVEKRLVNWTKERLGRSFAFPLGSLKIEVPLSMEKRYLTGKKLRKLIPMLNLFMMTK